MSIRSEIEAKLAVYASTQIPAIPVAYENVEFVKPANGKYLEIFFMDQARRSRNLRTDVRVSGMFQINCYCKSSLGMAAVEALRDDIMALYPVLPKMNSVSIEAPLSATAGYNVDACICISVTGQYRVEI